MNLFCFIDEICIFICLISQPVGTNLSFLSCHQQQWARRCSVYHLYHLSSSSIRLVGDICPLHWFRQRLHCWFHLTEKPYSDWKSIRMLSIRLDIALLGVYMRWYDNWLLGMGPELLGKSCDLDWRERPIVVNIKLVFMYSRFNWLETINAYHGENFQNAKMIADENAISDHTITEVCYFLNCVRTWKIRKIHSVAFRQNKISVWLSHLLAVSNRMV